VATIVYQ